MPVRKSAVRVIPRLFLLFSFLLHGSLYPQLDTLYKTGTLKLEADKTFGSQTDWESLFYNMYKSIVLGPDGSIFVSNSRQHAIFKFSPSGKFIARFGRKGQGPGDLYYPHEITVLDNRYLVVGEYASVRRISLFDLEGKFVKVLKTTRSCFSPLALQENRIAYLSYHFNKENVKEVKVWVKDVETGKEILITSTEISLGNFVKAKNNYTISFDSHLGELFIAGTGAGNLLVGISNTPAIDIYSPLGKRLRSFRLNIQPDLVTSRYIKQYKEAYMADISKNRAARPYLDLIGKTSFDKGFAKYLPYYRDILVDSAGRIVVFRWPDCVTHCPKKFQVYSPEGTYFSEVLLDEGEFSVEIDSRWKRLILSTRGIFAYVSPKDNIDAAPRLIKVKVPAGH
jgi:hypothetical protein